MEATTAAAEAEAKAFFLGNDRLQVTPTVSANAETVTVTATYSQPTFLVHLVGADQTTVNARAVAARGSPKKPCVIALEPSGKHGIMLNSESKLQMDCGVQVNSTNSEAVFTNANSTINSTQTCVTGGWIMASGSTPAPKKCPAIPDPLANLPIPAQAAGACTKTDFTINGGTSTLAPGVYCKTLTINAGAVVTLQPGIYVIRDGLLKVNSSSTLKGDNVLLFFTGIDTRMEMDSSSAIALTGRTEGPFVDMVIYQNRNNATDLFMINADTGSKFRGVIYLPKSGLKLNSRAAMAISPSSLALIVRNLELNSKASIIVDNKDFKPKLDGMKDKGASLIQ